MTLKVRRLQPGDDRKGFRSGNIELDRFFERYAGQNQFRHHLGATYVAVDEQGTIFGFATVTASELVATTLPEQDRKRLPIYPLPVLRLARLAVDERAQGHGIGRLLLRTVFLMAHRMATDIGCVGVVVDAKTDAKEFYHKLGFVVLSADAGLLNDRPEPQAMFLKLGAIPREM